MRLQGHADPNVLPDGAPPLKGWKHRIIALVHWSRLGMWCSGITPAQHAGGPGFNPQRVHFDTSRYLPMVNDLEQVLARKTCNCSIFLSGSCLCRERRTSSQTSQLVRPESIEKHETFMSTVQFGEQSDHPESNQGPSDSCQIYSQMLYQLSYDR